MRTAEIRIACTHRPLVLSLLGLVALAGCAAPTPQSASGGRTIELDEFVQQSPKGEAASNSDVEASQADADEASTRTPETLDVRTVTRAEASGEEVLEVQSGPPVDLSAPDNPLGAGDVVAARPEASSNTSPSSRTEERVSVDRLVGQVNGRPIFASEFFEPNLDARLRAEARRVSRGEASTEEWLRFARRRIQERLRELVRDELLLAEFEASLSPQEKQGLVTFVRNLRDSLISQNFGSESLADKRMREEEGMSLDEVVESRRNKQLIEEQLRRAIFDRVYVSWRDVELEYERRYDDFNPTGEANLRMIWLPAGDAEQRSEVVDKLEAGAPFAEVASQHSQFRPAEGGLYVIKLDEGGYEKTQLLRQEVLNDAAHKLEPGETTGPIELNGRAIWIHLEGVEREQKTLEEVQLQLFSELRDERFREENQRYLMELISSGSVTDLDKMEERLWRFAADRYLIAPATGRN